MKMNIKKTLVGLLTLCMAFSVCGCNLSFGGNSGSQTVNGVTYETVVKAQETKTLKQNESITYTIDKDITGKDYVVFKLNTNVNLLGKYVYHDVENASKVVEEEFFIEAAQTEFKQFLDGYRANAKGAFDKQLKTITLTNIDQKEGAVEMKDISVGNREFPELERELYVEGKNLKVGADLATGGALTYLERLSYVDDNGVAQTIDEVISHDDEVEIGVNAKEGAKAHLSSSVNLINIYDAGRQFQQSFYSNVGGTSADHWDKMEAGGYYDKLPEDYGSNGYDRAMCKTAHKDGYFWPYNPVQGGDVACNPSQIIDFEVTKNEIYVKTRAMDWAKGRMGDNLIGTVQGGVTTKSYMENWYTIKGDMVFVTNRFIDWNGFEGMESVPTHSNELPAAYVVHPLHNYVCYTGNRPWNGEELEWQPELGSWAASSHRNYNPAEEWFAWVNDEGFGVGVYIPNTTVFCSGRSNATTSSVYSNNNNAYASPMANEYRYNKPEATYPQQSCYVGNTCYTAPVVSWTMRAYQPMSYQYIIAVDYLEVMRESFKYVNESGEMKNEQLHAWD